MRALVGAVLMATVSVGAAQATADSPPVTVDDAVTLTAGGATQKDVLANDSDPDGDVLALCRLGKVPAALGADIFDGKLMIFGADAGTYTLTYYACDYSYLTPGTVTITVKPRPRIYVKVVKGVRPGTLRVINNGSFGFRYLWGSYKRQKADGQVSVPAHSSVRIRVRRVSVIWFAMNEHKGAFKIGIVRGITLPKGANALPPGAPPTPLPSSTMPRWGISAR
ncbi:hypothetical protein GCM10028772_26390 [Nocardioides ultimimeridianus]